MHVDKGEESIDPGESLRERALRAARAAAALLHARQAADGHWPAECSGPLFLLPGLLVACSIIGHSWSADQRRRMLLYLENVQNKDGGFGLHVESPSYMLCTALNYVALRLLGVEALAPRAQAARAWIHDHGGVEAVPTWGKVWLAVLGVYDWAGVNPIQPEAWLLPEGLPLHPSRMWCHTRQVYLPMSYLYGRRCVGPETDLVRALREELLSRPYDLVDWPACRERVATTDLYRPHTLVLQVVHRALLGYERVHSPSLRARALSRVLDQIRHDDESTGYLDIGPVSKALNMLALWFDDPRSPALARHTARIQDYLWDAPDGMRMQGYNGSQFWDLAFTLLALHEAGLCDEQADLVERAYRWADRNQLRRNAPEHARYYREPMVGAFPFSTAEQGWPVADCTAEGVKVSLRLAPWTSQPISAARTEEAVDHLLRSQNDDGGWSDFERTRGSRLLELLNPSEIFGRIMIGYSSVETTSSCLQGLSTFAAKSGHRRAEVERALQRGARYLLAEQRPDGSFYGTWGVCFTYGTWFGIEGLRASAPPGAREAIARAAAFLLEKQRADGGWGESYRSCSEGRWVEHAQSQVIHTAWAVLALLASGGPRPAIERGVRLLLERQEPDGGWPRESICAVFNQSCMIQYDAYRVVMPLWALGRYARSS